MAEEQEREEERQRAQELMKFQAEQSRIKNEASVRDFQESQVNALKT